MTPPPLNPPACIRQQILFFINRTGRPFLLGILANDIRCPLQKTESYCEQLVIEGILRKLDNDEALRIFTISDVIAYCVVREDVQLAHLA